MPHTLAIPKNLALRRHFSSIMELYDKISDPVLGRLFSHLNLQVLPDTVEATGSPGDDR